MIPMFRRWLRCWILPSRPLLCAACHTYPAKIAYMDTSICYACDRDLLADPNGVVAEALTRHG